MKNRLLNSFFRTAAAFALLLAAGACKDDVALPMQTVALNTHAILAPSFATTLSFDVEANCDWTISVAGDDTSWAELSQTEATGMATVAVSIAENNTSGSRSLTIRVVAKRNAAAAEELSFVQASATAEGYLSIPDLRKLAADGDYTVTQDAKMRGIVVSSVQDNNYYDNCIALQSALKANCGIALRTEEVLYRKPGEELEIDLKGAVVGVNPETGVMTGWVRRGACGWRLDVVDELPVDMVLEMREAVKQADPDATLLGEVWEDASNKTAYGVNRSYCLGDMLDLSLIHI